MLRVLPHKRHCYITSNLRWSLWYCRYDHHLTDCIRTLFLGCFASYVYIHRKTIWLIATRVLVVCTIVHRMHPLRYVWCRVACYMAKHNHTTLICWLIAAWSWYPCQVTAYSNTTAGWWPRYGGASLWREDAFQGRWVVHCANGTGTGRKGRWYMFSPWHCLRPRWNVATA